MVKGGGCSGVKEEKERRWGERHIEEVGVHVMV